MKKIKVSIFAVMAIVMGIAASAFTTKTPAKSPDTLFFYKYQLTSTTQANIQNIANYKRESLSCSGTNHVCGILLPTDQGANQQPLASEFNPEKTPLWDSEQASASVDPDVIKMRN